MDTFETIDLTAADLPVSPDPGFPLDAPRLEAAYRDAVPAACAAAEYRRGLDYLAGTHALTGGEPIPWAMVPKAYTRRDLGYLAWIAETMGSIMDKLTRAYLEDAEVRAAFGLPEALERLVLAPVPYGELIPIARVDVFLDEGTGDFAFCELNTDGSAGMLVNTEVSNALAAGEPFRAFTAARGPLRGVDLYGACARAILTTYREASGVSERPRVVAVDYAESVFMGEILAFKPTFEVLGAELDFADVRDLSYEGGVLSDARGPIDCVWHRVVTSELLEKPCPGADALIACALDGLVPIVGAMRTWPCATKTAFAVLRGPIAERILDADELAFVREHVPYTEVLGPESDLARFAERDRWIAKPSDGYAGRGVVAGADATAAEWDGVLAELARTGGIVQAYAPQYAMPIPAPDGSGELEVNAMQGLYLFRGRFGGVFTRAGAARVIDYRTSRYNMGCLVAGEF